MMSVHCAERTRLFVFRVAVTILSASLPLSGHGADEIVEMPKFVVTDSRALAEPENWRYATIPGFEILSNASDRQTQRLVSDFEQFKTVLQFIWPVPDQSQTPVLLILCGKRGKFSDFLAEGTAADGKRVSTFLNGRNRSAIIVDMETKVLDLRDITVSVPSTEGSPVAAAAPEDLTRMNVEHNKQLYREYVRYMLSKSDPRLPAWFEEGMTQIIMRVRIEPTLIEIGKVTPPDTVSAQTEAMAAANAAAVAADSDAVAGNAPADDRDFNLVLNNQRLLPMDKLLSVSHDAPEANNPYGAIIWAKQAYAFVHLCMYGQGGKWQKPLGQFLMRSSREPLTEAMFKECFGKSYKEMSMVLREYISFTDHESKQYRAKGNARLDAPTNITLREATQSEVGRIKGHALAMAGRIDAARTEYIAPYMRGDRDPQILAALGVIEKATGRDDRARKLLQAAVEGRTPDSDAYVELARYRFADALDALSQPNASFSDAQTAAITSVLLPARSLPPPNPAVFELLAETWVRSTTPPKESDVLALVAAVRRFPARLRLAYATAALCARVGLADPAHALVAHGIRFARDPAMRRQFEQLKETLPPQAAPATPQGAAGQPRR